MDSSIITVLAIILLILIVLNHITIYYPQKEASCSQTSFGCCPNGVDSKINYYGTNCPGYRPGPGYYPSRYVPPPVQNPGYYTSPYVPPPPPPPPVPAPIGGCAGTRYGCCPNNNTPKINNQGSNCILK